MSMTTLEFVSNSADGLTESATPLVSAAALIAGLGSHPTVTIPVVAGDEPDADRIWRRLAEPAEFFGITMPDAAQLRRTLADFSAELQRRHGAAHAAVTIVVVENRCLVSGVLIEPFRTEPVNIALCAGAPAPAHWQKMAARTTSRAAELLTERELGATGHADAVPAGPDGIGAPLLGALVCETAGGRIGLGAERLGWPAAVGLLDADAVTDGPVEPAAITRAWWVSPIFETHPVAAIGERRL